MTYGARSKTCFAIEQLSWGQHILLSAAVQVDYLPHRAWLQISLMHGVWRSLVIRGLLRPHRYGWEATEKGRKVIRSNRFIINPTQQKERPLMDGKLPRYSVAQMFVGWAVIDRTLAKVTKGVKAKIQDDVVETFPTRSMARNKANELNLQDAREKQTSGDAA
jgi:hypothetical protein